MLPAYAELHCLSNFTFLRGAAHAEELVTQASRLGYAALAITDECSLAGIVRAHVEAKATGLKLIVGAEFRLDDGLRLHDLAGVAVNPPFRPFEFRRHRSSCFYSMIPNGIIAWKQTGSIMIPNGIKNDPVLQHEKVAETRAVTGFRRDFIWCSPLDLSILRAAAMEGGERRRSCGLVQGPIRGRSAGAADRVDGQWTARGRPLRARPPPAHTPAHTSPTARAATPTWRQARAPRPTTTKRCLLKSMR